MVTETLQFQTETQKLLNLVINSVYTNKEIFLRELISNASDALDKLRIEALTNKSLINDEYKPEILIMTDKDAGTVIVQDNGIGMTREEVIENIGTIAKSGTNDFLRKLETLSDRAAQEFIGQFGIGFYSSFIVADRVELTTHKTGTEQGARWISGGVDGYRIQDYSGPGYGTEVKLFLKEEFISSQDQDLRFINPDVLARIVQKYSDFVRYPVKVRFEQDNGFYKFRTVNSMKPLWTRNKNEITREEYSNFLGTQFRGGKDPLEIIHVRAEGTIEYTALLFIPRYVPKDIFSSDYEAGVQLFSQHVMIAQRYQDILPPWLRFVQGLVDSADLPLNISRETLQQNKEVRVIGKALEKNVIKTLSTMLKNDRKKYETFWSEFGMAVKVGIYTSGHNVKLHEQLKDLFLFHTSKTGNDLCTLAEYVEHMPLSQDKIFVAAGKNLADAAQIPQVELLEDRNLEVIFLVDSIDEFVVRLLQDYKGKSFQFVTAEDFELNDNEAEKAKADTEKTTKEYKALLSDIKKVLTPFVQDVRLTANLKSKAFCLVTGDDSPSVYMEQALRKLGNSNVESIQILELNPKHRVFEKFKDLQSDKSKFQDFCKVIYSLALLANNVIPGNPGEMAHKTTEFLV